MLARAGFDGARETVPVKVTVPGWLRGPFRAVGSHAPPMLARPVIGAFNALPILPDTPPDLILGSGGTSAWALRLLGWQTGAATAFVGPWEPFARDWFTYGIAPDSAGAKDVATDFLVSRMTPETATQAALTRFGEAPRPGHWSILIGGRSRSHYFDAADWIALADSLNARARAASIRWLISTSPRTGAEAEAILAERLDPAIIAELVLWGRKPDKCAAAFMGGGERVFVTRDSLTMLSEAIASGRPVTAVTPRVTRFDDGYFKRMIERMDRAGWMDSISCTDLAKDRPGPAGLDPARFAEREKGIVTLLAPHLASASPTTGHPIP